jgi:hypothetical protein
MPKNIPDSESDCYMMKVVLLVVFCTVLGWILVINTSAKEQTQKHIDEPTIDMRGLPEGAIIEETMSNDWKVVRIKGTRFLFRYQFNGIVTIAPLPEQQK